jgi:hypothetical protein
MLRFSTPQPQILVALMLFLAISPCRAQESASEAERLAKFREQLAELKHQWSDDQNAMLHRIAALEERHRALKETTAELQVSIGKIQVEKNRLELDNAELLSCYNALQTAVAEEYQKLLQDLKPRLDACARLNLMESTSIKTTPVDHDDLGMLLTDFAEFATDTCGFANELHIGTNIVVAPEGEKLQMDTMVLGTMVAFAVSPDSSQAAVAIRRGENWTWHWIPEDATAIRDAIDICQGTSPPEILALPFPPIPNDGGNEQ